jgi:hypothetical protein
MDDLDDTHAEAVSACCRSAGEVLTEYGQTDLSELTPVRFRALIKAILNTWESERCKTPPF